MTTRPRIGLALSGGGFRAACFGLGCLRALHDADLLRDVTVVSGVSGGSLLAALYAYGPSEFSDFDSRAVEVLTKGLQLQIVLRALQPTAVARNIAHAALAVIRVGPGRKTNRTDALRDVLASEIFGDVTLENVAITGLNAVITATDLRTSNAVRFGSQRSSCSAYGAIVEQVTVAEAVAASAAFPILLPAVERRYAFRKKPGAQAQSRTLHLTDGGVYDNLGLTVLEPGRSPEYTDHVYELDYIIACDAGRGRLPLTSGHFVGTRLKRSFEVTHRRAQDAGRARLHQAAAAGLIRGFVMPYLGMRDNRLPMPVWDLVPNGAVVQYPTDFRAMNDRDLELISLRGEQLTRTLLNHYCPEL